MSLLKQNRRRRGERGRERRKPLLLLSYVLE
jgi:hypothetical protein